MTLKKLVPIAMVSILAAGASAFADAEREGAEVNEATALAQANVTLQQAIATVEQQTGGQGCGSPGRE